MATELVRLVIVDARLRVGARSGQPGRGASLHPNEACIAAAVRSRAFGRAFRQPLTFPFQSPADTEESNPSRVKEAISALMKDIEVSYVSQQPRAGRTP
jgi:predicted RNA-binding protein YlxR (DUF448 family)